MWREVGGLIFGGRLRSQGILRAGKCLKDGRKGSDSIKMRGEGG